MADDQEPTAQRSQADKERSRQQSRAVSGKEAAKGVAGKPGTGRNAPPKGGGSGGKGQPAKGQAKQPAKGQASKSQASKGQASKATGKGGGQRPPRNPRTAAASGPRRSTTALLTWGVVGIVLIVVIVIVVVKISSGGTTKGTTFVAGPVPATVVQQVTHVPLSVYNQVGITSPTTPVNPPNIVKGQPPLTLDGKPGVFYLGGEFCPYCAAERWAIITSMSRFGTFTGLKTMQSSSTDVYPSTQTFTMATATFKSPYITFVPQGGVLQRGERHRHRLPAPRPPHSRS